MFLVFRVRYLVEVHRARGTGGEDFPPHPIRLHAALVNAWARGGKMDRDKKALEWLENLDPPIILAPRQVFPWSTRGAYVPPNDKAPHFLREKQPLVHRALPLSAPHIFYVYKISSGEGSTSPWLQELRQLASRITYLGTSRNLVWVEVHEAQDLPNEPGLIKWVPGEGSGSHMFRVAFPGFLEESERRFQGGLRELPRRFQAYHVPQDIPDLEYHPSPWEFFAIRALVPALPMEWAVLFTHQLRQALLSHLPPGAPPVLTGHDPSYPQRPLKGTHLALMPLPYVGFRYSDGRILGVAFLLPRDTSATVKEYLHEALFRLNQVALPQRWKVELARPDGRESLQERRWRTMARRFVSALPVVFDHHPKKENFYDALAKSCQFAGFPTPVGAWRLSYPLVKGTVSSRKVQLPPSLKGYVAHAMVEFERPVEGPLLLGLGRYLGLGLFVPLAEEEEYAQV
ncbi:MAG: type I-U CRISPR-associated protein Csb2 [Thermus sp.]|nr:type I-U CRISPR-associated protein Csb2 [Thermus sp.]